MKKLLLILTLCFAFVAVETSAQVTPIDDRGKVKPAKEKKEKVYSEEEKAKKQLLQVELKMYVEGDRVKFEYKKVDIEKYGIKDKKKFEKFQFIEKLREQTEKEDIYLLAQLNSAGIKVVSHSFFIFEEGEREVHYYILEL